jgi:hypothetical protein
MSNELAKKAINSVRVRPMSSQVAEVRNNINLIQEAMKATMKKDVHYGTIPGCPKPSLYKAGAEVIMALFKLSTDPVVTDLSKDIEIRYQVKVNITTREGVFVGSGIGECSSSEEKYSWRSAVCQEEFDATPENLRRIKFKKQYNAPVAQIQQVRVNPGDMANTILKMAKKRALIDAVLTATGASDIFAQDIEDLPEGFIQPEMPQEAPKPAETPITAPKAEIVEPTWQSDEISPSPQPAANVISDAQRKRLFAIAMGAGMSKESLNELVASYGYASSKEIRKADYEKICKDAETYNPVGA